MPFEDKSILSHKKVLSIAWQSQMDSDTAWWYRMCGSSSAAMMAEYLKAGVLKNHKKRRSGEQLDDFYLRLLQEGGYGDTTDANAHVALLRALGVNVKFRQDKTRETLEWYLAHDLPVMVGWLHHGLYYEPNPQKSHWSVVVGYDPAGDCFVFHDPAGTANISGGGYLDNNGRYRKYPWEQWKHRWMANERGDYVPGTGWAILPETDKATGLYKAL